MPLGYTTPVELRHLRYFVTAAEELNISRAAARLRVSQPAISRQIRDLEYEVGMPLFAREKHGLKLTPAGDSFLPHAKDLLRRASEALDHMAALRGKTRRITVGYITPVLVSILTPALRVFVRKHPKVEVEVKELAPAAQEQALRDGSIDLALLGNPCPKLAEEFELRILARVPLQAVLPDDHLLALRKRVGLPELEGETFVGFQDAQFPGRNAAILEACREAGFTPSLLPMAGTLNDLLASVAAGKGVSLAPAEVANLPHPQVCFVPLKNPVPTVSSAAAMRKDEKDPLVGDLLEIFRKSL